MPFTLRLLNTTLLLLRSRLIGMSLAMIIFGSVGFFSEHAGFPALELVFIRCLAAFFFLGVLWGLLCRNFIYSSG